jgi:2-haloacid dehalogenase
MSLLTEMAKRAGLPWDCILSAEVFRHYKPDPQTYLGVCDLFGVRPSEMMLVAAHKDDLDAALALGCKTAFVERPLEFGPDKTVDLAREPRFDIHACDFIDLANQLCH